jgi:transcription elongation factor GreA
MQKIPLTVTGALLLRQELEKLKNIERPKITKAIAEARAHGDLRENAEYHAAKELQGFIEGRIRDLENKLAHANIIDISKIPKTGTVIFGCTVHIVNLNSNQKYTYQLVGDDEADIKVNKISINSPIARALIGKKIGVIVDATTPSGVISYEITNVEYI